MRHDDDCAAGNDAARDVANEASWLGGPSNASLVQSPRRAPSLLLSAVRRAARKRLHAPAELGAYRRRGGSSEKQSGVKWALRCAVRYGRCALSADLLLRLQRAMCVPRAARGPGRRRCVHAARFRRVRVAVRLCGDACSERSLPGLRRARRGAAWRRGRGGRGGCCVLARRCVRELLTAHGSAFLTQSSLTRVLCAVAQTCTAATTRPAAPARRASIRARRRRRRRGRRSRRPPPRRRPARRRARRRCRPSVSSATWTTARSPPPRQPLPRQRAGPVPPATPPRALPLPALRHARCA
jgi:hypothetical protein